MPSFRIPVLIWQDHEGLFTACPVEPATKLVGTGTTARQALAQIKQYLEWSAANDDWLRDPEISDEEVRFISVTVRPIYVNEDDRRYPCDEQLTLRIPCVVGKRRDDVQVCSIPTLSFQFDFYSRDSFEELAGEAVRGCLANQSPAGLLRFLPPKSVRLDRVFVRTKSKVGRTFVPRTDELDGVTESLNDRLTRRRFNPAWMRDAEVANMVELLDREQASVLLVGERGVGKTTLLVDAVRTLVQRHKKRKVQPGDEKATRFYLTNAARLISGMQYLGEWQQRCESIVEELTEMQGVLCIENLLDLVRTGGRDATDSLAAFFRTFTRHNELRMVCEVTQDELCLLYTSDAADE